jgi:hypothetical protein
VEEVWLSAFPALFAVGFQAHLEGLPEVFFVRFVNRGGQSLHQPPELTLEGSPLIFGYGRLNMGHSFAR